MKKIQLMTHVVIGYPSLEDTSELVETMVNAGADMVELQIPFSDPMADGPTITKACEASLANGTKVKDAFSLMEKLSKEVSVPLYFMAYYNTVFIYGTEQFIRDAKNAGARGLIVPDMPLEEESEEHFYKLCSKYGVHAIHVISPVTPDDRLRKHTQFILRHSFPLRQGFEGQAGPSAGFLYATAQQGTTGARDNLQSSLDELLHRVSKHFQIPIAVGFGISKREHVQSLVGKADVAIVGSAIIDIINKSTKDHILINVRDFIRNLKMVE